MQIPTVPRKERQSTSKGLEVTIHATYTTISIRTHLSTVHDKLRRPEKEDEKREDYDALARLIWRVFIVLTVLGISLALREWETPETIGIVIEKTPELVKEFVEYAKRL